MIRFREAGRGDVEAVVALLVDDVLGAGREVADMALYHGAFVKMRAEAANHLIVGEEAGRIVATYQITFISGLSLRAARRAQVESVRVASDFRGRGIGRAMIADAETRARAAGCSLMQLNTNRSRDRARVFYESLGYEPSHIGFKKPL